MLFRCYEISRTEKNNVVFTYFPCCVGVQQQNENESCRRSNNSYTIRQFNNNFFNWRRKKMNVVFTYFLCCVGVQQQNENESCRCSNNSYTISNSTIIFLRFGGTINIFHCITCILNIFLSLQWKFFPPSALN